MHFSKIVLAFSTFVTFTTAASVLFPRQGCTPETAIAVSQKDDMTWKIWHLIEQ